MELHPVQSPYWILGNYLQFSRHCSKHVCATAALWTRFLHLLAICLKVRDLPAPTSLFSPDLYRHYIYKTLKDRMDSHHPGQSTCPSGMSQDCSVIICEDSSTYCPIGGKWQDKIACKLNLPTDHGASAWASKMSEGENLTPHPNQGCNR